MLIQILVFVSNRPEGVNSLMSGGLNLFYDRERTMTRQQIGFAEVEQ
jgi:hypothetical protein